MDYSFREKGFQEMVAESISAGKASACPAWGSVPDFLHHDAYSSKARRAGRKRVFIKKDPEEIMNTTYPSHAGSAGLLVVVFASVAFAQSEQIGKKPSVEQQIEQRQREQTQAPEKIFPDARAEHRRTSQTLQ